MLAAFVLAATLTDADIIRGFVNLARLNRLGFALQYRAIQYGNLNIGTTPHERAVALQLREEELVDPWGTPYRIEINGKESRVTGAGADRKFEENDDKIAGRVKTDSLTADVIWGDGHTVQGNYTWLFRQVGKPPDKLPGMYDVPVFEPIHLRDPNRFPATPDDARYFELVSEGPTIYPRFGDLDVIRVMQTRASMELLAFRLDAWRVAHGSFASLAGTDVIAKLQSEPWPYNDWLLGIDQWGAAFRLEISPDGKSYKLTSAGAPKYEQVMQDGKFVVAFDAAAYEASLRKRDEEQAKKPRAPIAGPDGIPIYVVGGDVTAPVATHKVDPAYPASALKAKAGGLCIVEAIVDEHGNVTSPKLLFAENDDLGKAAIEAVRQWKFKPAMRNGVAVRVIYNLTVSFNPN